MDRFGESAKWLVQHPTQKVYSNSVLHHTISQVLQCYRAARRGLKRKVRTRWDVQGGTGLNRARKEKGMGCDKALEGERVRENEACVRSSYTGEWKESQMIGKSLETRTEAGERKIRKLKSKLRKNKRD